MSSFELNIDELAFKYLGVNVTYDSETYDYLIDGLAEQIEGRPIQPPTVNIAPAPVWYMSRWDRYASTLRNNPKEWVGGDYDPNSQSINLRAGTDATTVNRNLLYNTMQWAGDLSGALAKDRQELSILRRRHNGQLIAGGVGMVALGYQYGGGGGILVGITLSGWAGLRRDKQTARNTTFNRYCRDFATDPETIEDYGQIIRYD